MNKKTQPDAAIEYKDDGEPFEQTDITKLADDHADVYFLVDRSGSM